MKRASWGFLVWICLLVTLTAAESGVELTLPTTCYGVAGVPLSLYYDNVVLSETPLKFEIACDIGRAEATRWTVVPTDTEVGLHSLEIVVKDGQGAILQRGQTRLVVLPKNAGAGRELRLLVIGDSLTHASVYPNEMARLLSQPENPAWTMLGTHRPAQAAPKVAHEGYGGWTWNSFLTRYVANPERTPDGKLGKDRSSPFVYAGADGANGKPGLDIGRYLREECANKPPDVITFLLGINDCFGADLVQPGGIDKSIDAALANAEKLLHAFHEAAPKAALAVGLTTPPNSREEGFEANYKGKYHRWGWKRIQHRLVQRMIQQFQKREGEGIYLVPTELNVDPVEGYPLNNGVHPNAIGYAQIGSTFYCWLKWWLTQPHP